MKNYLVKVRIFLISCFVLIKLQHSVAQNKDSIINKANLFSVTYNPIPSIFKGMYRYKVINDYTNKWHSHAINQSIQNNLSEKQLLNNSVEQNYIFLKGEPSRNDYKISLATDEELYFGIWRAKLLTIKNENDLKEIMNYGTSFLLSKGYTIPDILPFISLLLQEHTDYHYDNYRTKIFEKNSKGIVSLVDIMQKYNNYTNPEVIGVCRDVHDAALRMTREICTTYYNTLYPEKKINIDDYLFLTSWATQSSQHVTVSLIDPLNTKKTYELDWGRLIEKNNNVGYEHGRNYGNVYRVWKFDSKKNITKPLDNKKTSVGNFLDDQLYNDKEFDAFAGIKYVEPYSAFKFEKKLNSKIKLNTSLGTLSQSQKFAQATLYKRSEEKKLGKLLLYSGTSSFQTLLIEEGEKKNLMFPINNYNWSSVLYFFPRYIANLKTKNFYLSKNISCNFFTYGSIELFLYTDAYKLSISKKAYHSQSADGGIYFSQGYMFNYKSNNSKFNAELKLQNRSFLIAKEVRLMSPNPIELLSNATLVSPAQNLILNLVYDFTSNIKIKTKSIVEYTNQKNILSENQLEVQSKTHKIGYFIVSGAICKNLKGIQYFWYPVNRAKAELNFLNKKQSFKVGLNAQFYEKKEVYFGTQISFNL